MSGGERRAKMELGAFNTKPISRVELQAKDHIFGAGGRCDGRMESDAWWRGLGGGGEGEEVGQEMGRRKRNKR